MDRNSASQVIGEPNVINGDHSKAWKPSSASLSQQQSLQVMLISKQNFFHKESIYSSLYTPYAYLLTIKKP